LADKENPNVYAYTRELNGRKLLVLLNFTAQETSAKTDFDLSKAKVLIGNYKTPSTVGKLKPYEGVIFKIQGEL
jgi:oligo-1,6-glucosidase